MARFRSRSAYQLKYPYPRRQFIRGLLRGGIRFASSLLLKYKVEGLENLPEQGPLLLVGNHFHFLDTISPIHTTPYALEFIGDAVMPNAPGYLRFFPSLWGTLQILQGTPNLDAMAAAGVRFNRFYSAHPSCSPTRASVMTGRHPYRAGVTWPGMPLRKQEFTIAQAIKRAGYTTGHFGKWHLSGGKSGASRTGVTDSSATRSRFVPKAAYTLPSLRRVTATVLQVGAPCSPAGRMLRCARVAGSYSTRSPRVVPMPT